MSYRTQTGSNDKAYFTRTAARIKRVNYAPKIMRGGIRF